MNVYRAIRFLILSLGATRLFTSAAYAQSEGSKIRICNESTLQDFCKDENFGSSAFAVQAELNRCMNEMLVCRRYGELANKLLVAINTAEGSLPPVQEYFLGSAIFRLHLLTRSDGTRCELMKMAKEHLGNFLSLSKVKYKDSGSFGSIGLRYIRDAVNSFEILNRPNSCPETPPTKKMLMAEAVNYAYDSAEELFRNVEIKDPFQSSSGDSNPVQAKMNEIFAAIQAFTSNASQIEIGSKMIEVELAGNDARLNQIIKTLAVDVYTQSDGSVGIGANGSLTLPAHATKVERARQTSTAMATSATAMDNAKAQAEAKISELLSTSQSGADSYNSLRIKYSSLAYSWAAEASFQSQASDLLSPQSSLAQLFAKTSAAAPEDSPSLSFNNLKLAYYEKYKAICGTLAGRGRWYCKS